MSYGHLLKTQANDVLNVISENGLNPEDFTWDTGQTMTLKHTSSDYFFTFEPYAFEWAHEAHYSPGEVSAETHRRANSWEEQLSLVQKWLTNLKRETQAPDLWSLVSEQTALVEAASADSPNNPFSVDEIEKISDGLSELQAYIEATHHLDEQKHRFLESRLGYLVDAANRQGRQDWLHTAIGVLLTIVWGLAMAPEQAREIFRFIGNVLSILKTHPLLP